MIYVKIIHEEFNMWQYRLMFHGKRRDKKFATRDEAIDWLMDNEYIPATEDFYYKTTN